jgi:hypothetical protein
MINTLTLHGTVEGDVEEFACKTGRPGYRATVVCTEKGYQGKEEINRFKITWFKDAGIIRNGDKIIISGKLASRQTEYNGKTFYNIDVKVKDIVIAQSGTKKQLEFKDDESMPF